MVDPAPFETPGSRASRAMARPIGVALWFLLLTGGEAPAQAIISGRPTKVDTAIYRELQEQGSTCVCVELRHAATGQKSLAERSRTFRRVQQAFLDTLPDDDDFQVRHRYHYSPVIVLEVKARSILALLESSRVVRRVICDIRGEGGLVESRGVIRADRVHELGVLGEGQVLAVLDSGVDTDHPDLEDAIIHQHHFLRQGRDTGEGAEDDNGHGTHVTGIIASRGVVAPVGVAPGSRIVAVKVLDRRNSGWFSDWTAGVEHVTRLHLEDNGIQIGAMNLSLRSFNLFSEVCDEEFPALHLAIEAAREAGIITFACSGNGGRLNELTIPGCYSSTVSVGSVPDDAPDELSWFTNRGPLLDLLAPGELITSSGVDGGSEARRGCSFATPHVVAVAGLVREVDPALDPDTLYELLRTTAFPVVDARSGRTYPRVDAHAAVLAAGLRAEPRRFHRGDANADGRLDLVDSVFSLNYLFFGSNTPACLEAVDANDDDRVDIADSIYLLQFLALGGAAPPPPGPPGFDCAVDATRRLGCVRYGACD